jgi:UPF0716 protein FxsA
VLARLFLLFTIVPIVELALLIQVGRWIGTLPTIGFVVATAALGAWLARREGLRAWRRVRSELASGQMPASPMLNGLAVFFGGTLLLTPGVLTDFLGLALLAPPTRAILIRGLKRRLEVQVMRSTGEIEARFWSRDDDLPPDREIR